jgi:hypothetical protein
MLENTRARLSRRFDRRVETVDAVYDDQLWDILESEGLLGKLDAGELTCYWTGIQLSRDNVGGLIVTPEGLKVISDSASHN